MNKSESQKKFSEEVVSILKGLSSEGSHFPIVMCRGGERNAEWSLSLADFIQRIVAEHKFFLNDHDQMVRGYDNRTMDFSQTVAHFCWYVKLGLGNFSTADIELAISQFIDRIKTSRHNEMVEGISFQPCALEAGAMGLKNLLIASTGQADELDLNVLRHWIWQAKRKLIGKPIDHHLMPIFYGPQGAGKSEMVKRFLSPVYRDHIVISFSELADSRCYRIFNSYGVIFADEMSGADRASVNLIKQLITNVHSSGRPMRTNEIEKVTNRASWIGSSNDPVNEIILDASGNRRFYQITCLPRGEWDYESINSIDYQAVWRAIDEDAESPLISGGLVERLYERQKGWKHTDLVEEWLKEMNFIPQGDAQRYFYTFPEIRSAFLNYLSDARRKAALMPSDNKLGRLLKGHGLEEDRRTVPGVGQQRGYWLGRRLDIPDSAADAASAEWRKERKLTSVP